MSQSMDCDFLDLGIDDTEAASASYTGGGGGEPIPNGRYLVAVEKAEKKTTKKGGQAAVFYLAVKEGEHFGRVLRLFTNIRNASPTAEQIGRAELAKLYAVCGEPRVTTGEAIYGKRFAVDVIVEKRTDKVADDGSALYSNAVVNMFPASAYVPGAAKPAEAATTSAPTPANQPKPQAAADGFAKW